MATLPLETGIIYGPIRSRRLGLSLGVNILPTAYKPCTFDCIYCHYGRTVVKTFTPPPGSFPGATVIARAVEKALRAYPGVDAVTFSGNGEPTLHPYFAEVAFAVRQVRDRLAPQARLTLFSNATTAHLPEIRRGLAYFDAPLLKLDAGDPLMLARINRPAPGVTLTESIAALKALPGCLIQSVLIDGEISNVRGAAFEAWLAALAEIRPARVQIYSTDYPVPEAGVEKVPPFRLREIAAAAQARTGVIVEAFWAEAQPFS